VLVQHTVDKVEQSLLDFGIHSLMTARRAKGIFREFKDPAQSENDAGYVAGPDDDYDGNERSLWRDG
jgi:hypothetical protein